MVHAELADYNIYYLEINSMQQYISTNTHVYIESYHKKVVLVMLLITQEQLNRFC